ncbi:MAG: IS1096 element passenger TnpR family protein [Flavobacteriales bacterium]
MNVFKFRVIVDTEADVFRDIEMATDATFLALHEAILRAFEWEEGEMASFYLSNEDWDKGQEIPLMDMGMPEESGTSISMSTTALRDLISRPDEKLIYVYDFFRMWCFYIELQTVSKAKPGILYPRVALAFGESPDYASKEVDLLGGLPDLDDLGDLGEPAKPATASNTRTGDPEIDQYLDDLEDDGGGENFQSLDDLDEFI